MKTLALSIAALWLMASTAWLPAPTPSPQWVAVRHPQGTQHGFLALRSLDGVNVGDGDSIQTVAGDRVTSRTVFRFRDGSVDDETAVFTQRGVYRLISDRLIESGPSFEHPLTMDIDVAGGRVTVRHKGDHGEDKVDDQRIPLPVDLCDGLIITLLQDVAPDRLPLTVPLLVATPTPRLVKLVVTRAGEARFTIGTWPRMATEFLIKTDLGGLSALLAPLFAKQPPDAHVWVLGGEAPAFVKSEAPMVPGGPPLRTELANPAWPR